MKYCMGDIQRCPLMGTLRKAGLKPVNLPTLCQYSPERIRKSNELSKGGAEVLNSLQKVSLKHNSCMCTNWHKSTNRNYATGELFIG